LIRQSLLFHLLDQGAATVTAARSFFGWGTIVPDFLLLFMKNHCKFFYTGR